MKKKMLFTIGILTAAALSLSACGKTASKAPAASTDTEISTDEATKEDTPAEGEAPTEEETPVEETTDISEDMSPEEIMDLRYGTIVEKYLTAITDQWTSEDLEKNDMSFLTTYHYEKGVDSMGVNGNFDLNGDDSPELLIGDMDENSDHMIYAAYTIKGTDAVPLFISSERDRYYLTELLEDDPMAVNVYRIGSNGASDSFNATYLVEDDQLTLLQGIIYNDSKNPDSPWYQTYDNDMNLDNAESITEADALAINESNDMHISHIEYVPLTVGFVHKTEVANPIFDATPEEVLAQTGLELIPVDGSTEVNYAIIDGGSGEKIAEMNFTLNGKHFCYRAKSTSTLYAEDISGFYYNWDKTETVKVNYCEATYVSCADASNIYWWDAAPGVMYSLSVIEPTEQDELVELANQIFVPTQGEA